MTRFCRGRREPGRSALASAAAQTDSSVQCRQFYVLQRALLGAFCVFFPPLWCVRSFSCLLYTYLVLQGPRSLPGDIARAHSPLYPFRCSREPFHLSSVAPNLGKLCLALNTGVAQRPLPEFPGTCWGAALASFPYPWSDETLSSCVSLSGCVNCWSSDLGERRVTCPPRAGRRTRSFTETSC